VKDSQRAHFALFAAICYLFDNSIIDFLLTEDFEELKMMISAEPYINPT